MKIRLSRETEISDICTIHKQAFGEEKGPEIAALVKGLFEDQTALPSLSLVAVEKEQILGHILFTRVDIVSGRAPVAAQILAPLAIRPGNQRQGIGGHLIEAGLQRLKADKVPLVFVLGHPDYYPRSGFQPAGALGFEAPYPIPAEHADAWMVQALGPAIIGKVKGRVQCCTALDHPEHWRE